MVELSHMRMDLKGKSRNDLVWFSLSLTLSLAVLSYDLIKILMIME